MYIRENAIDYLIYIFFFVRLSAVLVCFFFPSIGRYFYNRERWLSSTYAEFSIPPSRSIATFKSRSILPWIHRRLLLLFQTVVKKVTKAIKLAPVVTSRSE